MTGGRGNFEMEFSHYEQVPGNIAQKVIAETQAAKKAEKPAFRRVFLGTTGCLRA
jgi:elongation factor G